MVGCPSDFPDFLEVLDLYLAKGSVVHILSERDVDSREQELQLAYGIDRQPQGESGSLFHNLKLEHYVGPTTSQRHLALLPLSTAHCVLILSEASCPEERAMA